MKFLLVLFILVLTFSSCTINTNLMLKTDKDYVYAELTDSVIYGAKEYRLAPNDIIQFRVFDNKASVIVNSGISSGVEDNAGRNQQLLNPRNQLSYRVENDSMVKLPILGPTKLAGLTILEAEDTLESLFSTYYVDPFVQLNVTNKRVIVFPGNGGDATVITLVNNNTTLMEVLGYASGIPVRGKASHIKLMRNVNGTRHVYLIDLSTIEGLKYTDMLVQANDYIYVEPVPEIGREILRDIAPIVSILSSSLLIYTVINTLGN